MPSEVSLHYHEYELKVESLPFYAFSFYKERKLLLQNPGIRIPGANFTLLGNRVDPPHSISLGYEVPNIGIVNLTRTLTKNGFHDDIVLRSSNTTIGQKQLALLLNPPETNFSVSPKGMLLDTKDHYVEMTLGNLQLGTPDKNSLILSLIPSQEDENALCLDWKFQKVLDSPWSCPNLFTSEDEIRNEIRLWLAYQPKIETSSKVINTLIGQLEFFMASYFATSPNTPNTSLALTPEKQAHLFAACFPLFSHLVPPDKSPIAPSFYKKLPPHNMDNYLLSQKAKALFFQGDTPAAQKIIRDLLLVKLPQGDSFPALPPGVSFWNSLAILNSLTVLIGVIPKASQNYKLVPTLPAWCTQLSIQALPLEKELIDLRLVRKNGKTKATLRTNSSSLHFTRS